MRFFPGATSFSRSSGGREPNNLSALSMLDFQPRSTESTSDFSVIILYLPSISNESLRLTLSALRSQFVDAFGGDHSIPPRADRAPTKGDTCRIGSSEDRFPVTNGISLGVHQAPGYAKGFHDSHSHLEQCVNGLEQVR